MHRYRTMMSSRIQAALFIIVGSFLLTEACNRGIFGSRCQFKCHCDKNECNAAGECVNGRGCASGWFGPLCQYEDLAFLGSKVIATSEGHDGHVLADGDDDSCLKNVNYVTVELFAGTRLNWLQLKGDNIGDVSIRYKALRSESDFTRTCKDIQTVRNQNKILDISCQTDVNVEAFNISWTGNSEVCTLHISGGRNFALNEQATQTSTKRFIPIGFANASLAVDGNLDTNFDRKSCSHTENDTLPTWYLHLPTPQHVNRFVVYNRLDVGSSFRPDCCPDKLKGFSLQVSDVNGHKVLDYTDRLTDPQVIYNITTTDYVDASSMQISVLNPEHVLVICEVEIYGFDLCPRGKYGPECMFTCHCLDPTEACHVESGSCKSGCPAGFQGPNCETDCQPGKPLPATCTQHPCINCVNLECDSVTRRCHKGCLDKNSTATECVISVEPSTCTQQVLTSTCNGTFFGSNCQYKCHCPSNLCDDKGDCKYGTTCAVGWFGVGCQYQDVANIAAIVTYPKHNPALITDGDDATCILALENIQVHFPEPYPFTWMRIIALEPATSRNIYQHLATIELEGISNYHIATEIKFTDSRTGEEITCFNPIADTLDKRTTDFYCDLNSTMRSINITLKEPKSICSLFISGGVNIALKQPSQLTTNPDESVNAVDGVLSRNGDKCARTDAQDKNPSWTLSLPHQYRVFRYVVHSGINNLGQRQGFKLSSYTSSGVQVFSYTVQSIPDPDGVTAVLVHDVHQLISSVKIEPYTNASVPMLTLCEVEVFGENPCQGGMFGPACDRRCNCAEPNDVCLVATGGCQSGCAPGFFGEGCDTSCTQGSYGIDCRTECSDACINHLCHKVTGACF